MNKTYKLFLISFTIVMIVTFIATFSAYLNLGQYGVLLPAVLTIAFGISIAGVIFGVSEVRKLKSKKIIIALSGHVLILCLFFYIVYLALMGTTN
jgi:hypothetical protein